MNTITLSVRLSATPDFYPKEFSKWSDVIKELPEMAKEYAKENWKEDVFEWQKQEDKGEGLVTGTENYYIYETAVDQEEYAYVENR